MKKRQGRGERVEVRKAQTRERRRGESDGIIKHGHLITTGRK